MDLTLILRKNPSIIPLMTKQIISSSSSSDWLITLPMLLNNLKRPFDSSNTHHHLVCIILGFITSRHTIGRSVGCMCTNYCIIIHPKMTRSTMNPSLKPSTPLVQVTYSFDPTFTWRGTTWKLYCSFTKKIRDLSLSSCLVILTLTTQIEFESIMWHLQIPRCRGCWVPCIRP